MGDRDERLNDRLRDAHAMAKQAERMPSAQAARLEHHPEVEARIERHEAGTRAQGVHGEARHLALGHEGHDRPGRRDDAGPGGAMMSDEVVKGAMASCAFEHAGVAMYKVPIAAAEADGDARTAEACRTDLREEEAMAAWLAEHMVRGGADLSGARRSRGGPAQALRGETAAARLLPSAKPRRSSALVRRLSSASQGAARELRPSTEVDPAGAVRAVQGRSTMLRTFAAIAALSLTLGLAACDDDEEVELETPQGEVEIDVDDD